MSVAHNKARKRARKAKSDEHRAILSDLRKEKFPKQFFEKDGEGTDRLQRQLIRLTTSGRLKRKLTWNRGSTIKAFLGLSKKVT
jgi:hypothetical protein